MGCGIGWMGKHLGGFGGILWVFGGVWGGYLGGGFGGYLGEVVGGVVGCEEFLELGGG